MHFAEVTYSGIGKWEEGPFCAKTAVEMLPSNFYVNVVILVIGTFEQGVVGNLNYSQLEGKIKGMGLSSGWFSVRHMKNIQAR